jgi:hypothetical protein
MSATCDFNVKLTCYKLQRLHTVSPAAGSCGLAFCPANDANVR